MLQKVVFYESCVMNSTRLTLQIRDSLVNVVVVMPQGLLNFFVRYRDSRAQRFMHLDGAESQLLCIRVSTSAPKRSEQGANMRRLSSSPSILYLCPLRSFRCPPLLPSSNRRRCSHRRLRTRCSSLGGLKAWRQVFVVVSRVCRICMWFSGARKELGKYGGC